MTDMATRGSAPSNRLQALGAYGEEVAARHLLDRGMVILERNWRCNEGEIDIVARDGATLVVVEVKTRSSLSSGTPHEAITDEKLARLKRLGQRWVEERGIRPAGVRIDLVAILRPRRGKALIDHVQGLY